MIFKNKQNISNKKTLGSFLSQKKSCAFALLPLISFIPLYFSFLPRWETMGYRKEIKVFIEQGITSNISHVFF